MILHNRYQRLPSPFIAAAAAAAVVIGRCGRWRRRASSRCDDIDRRDADELHAAGDAATIAEAAEAPYGSDLSNPQRALSVGQGPQMADCCDCGGYLLVK